MNQKNQQKTYSKSREQARQIYEDVFSEESRGTTPEPKPSDSPYSDQEEESERRQFPEWQGEECPPTLVDGDLLGRLAKASGEERGEILKECPFFDGPENNEDVDLEDIIKEGPWEAGQAVEVDDWNFDVCAYYKPIHFYGENFGIVIRQGCMERIARRIASVVDPAKLDVSTEDAARSLRLAAYSGLLLHEFYHHKAESFSIRLAVGLSHFDLRNHNRSIPYLDYSKKVYRHLMQPGNASLTDQFLVEEALANAYSYRQINQVPYRAMLPKEIHAATRACLKASFRFQPPGYRMAVEYLGTPIFSEGERMLQQQMLEGAYSPSSFGRKWHSAPGMLRSVFLVKEVPTHVASW